jgi:UDP-N-acetylglucosamine acyltransferase
MIHQLAAVDKRAKISKNVIVEPFTTIAGDVEIGEGTWIGPNVTIMDGARIGKNCRIFPGTVISAIPQDLNLMVKIPKLLLVIILRSENV